MRFRFFTALTILVMILLAACTPQPEQPEQAEPVPQPEVDLPEVDPSFEVELQYEVAPQFPEPEVAHPAQVEPEQPEAVPQLPEPEVAHPAQVEPEPEPPELEPDSLIGIDQDSLIKQFGTPDYERLEGSIRILQYRLAPCVVDFIANDSIITAWAGRHRQYGADYHHHACIRALAQIKR